jgi:alpha-L-arabinofuranosidase
MLAHSFQPVHLNVKVENSGDKLKATAQESDSHKTLVLRVVHTGAEPLPARLTLKGFVPEKSVVHVEELAGPLEAVNTAADPERIKPRSFDWRHALRDGAATYRFPPYSFTVIRFE